MSYIELRVYIETMKSLGYPRPISLDGFRSPNFELVADCLAWLIHRISPDSNLCDDISTESERVRFLQAVASITLSKTRTRLNLKRLYAADGAAVRELLKLAQLLHKATHTVSTFEEEASEVIDPLVTLKLLDASAASAAARQVVRAGPALHDGLTAEAGLKDARLRALAAAQNGSMVEASIQEALSGLAQGLASLEQQLSEAGTSEAQLNARLEKWTGELERAEKRLATLAGVRPPYMDEYEALTGQLQVLWLHYLERFRNLQYLEAQLDSYRRVEQDAAAAAERKRKKLQQRLAEEELRILRGEQDVGSPKRATAASAGGINSGSSSDTEAGSSGEEGSWKEAGQAAGRPGEWGGCGIQQQQPGGSKVVGSLTAGWEDDDSTGDDDSSAGVLSHGGSTGSAAAAGLGGVGGGRLGGTTGSDSLEGEASIMQSEDSGF